MIKIETIENKILVYTIYNREWIDKCHELNGHWISNKKAWSFNKDYETYVRDALFTIFGFDEHSESIDVKYKAEDFRTSDETIKIGNKLVAIRNSRDSQVTLFDTVVVNGKLDKSGGSTKYPAVLNIRAPHTSDITFRTTINKRIIESLSSEELQKLNIIK